jgi:hypothetical protein
MVVASVEGVVGAIVFIPLMLGGIIWWIGAGLNKVDRKVKRNTRWK